MVMMPVRWQLKEIAEPERWTARKLALQAGLAYNTVWLIWTGKARRADLETIDALCRILKVKPGDLLTWHEEEIPPPQGGS